MTRRCPPTTNRRPRGRRQVNLLYSRDHSVSDGLQYTAAWNMGMLQTDDVGASIHALEAKMRGSSDEPSFDSVESAEQVFPLGA